MGRNSDTERNGLREGGVEGGLKVQEFEGSKMRRGRKGRRGEDSGHTRREDWRRGSGSSGGSGAEDDELELSGGEERVAIGVVIGQLRVHARRWRERGIRPWSQQWRCCRISQEFHR